MSLPAVGKPRVTATRIGVCGSRRRPWWIWATPAAITFAVLVSQNTFLFSTSLFEQSDSAADSILVRQATHLDLLTGHYSRYGFHHPGPAYMYLLASGEGVMYNVLHLVPTPWNGQFFAAFALSGALASMAVAIVYGLTRRVAPAAAAYAVVCLLILNRPDAAVSVWPPSMFIMTYLVFLLAAASVAARRSADLWILALTGWLLIHGYAPFLLLFVPLILTATAAFALWPARRDLRAAARHFFRGRRRDWGPVVVISTVFMFPMALNLVLHWPGDFGGYLSFSARSGGYRVSQVLLFMAWYLHSSQGAWLGTVACVLVAGVVLVAARIAGRGRSAGLVLKRFSYALSTLAGLTTVAFGWYVADGSAGTLHYFIGYFFWAVPFSLILIVVIRLAVTLGDHPAVRIGSLAAVVALLATLVSGTVSVRAGAGDSNPVIPRIVTTMASHSKGDVSVLGPVADPAWFEVMGILLQAQRTGVPVCVATPAGGYRVVLREFQCGRADLTHGVRYAVAAGPRGVGGADEAIVRMLPQVFQPASSKSPRLEVSVI